MTRNSKMNLTRLNELLDRYPRSQKQLASEICVDEVTLSRWKSGKTSPQTNHLANLCKALGTTPTYLCSDGPPIESKESGGTKNRGQVNMTLDTACRNALSLIARRYGVTRQQIVEVSPLLFFIMAEQSLRKRREQLEALKRSFGEVENSAAPHLSKWLRAPFNLEDQELLEAEEHSIKERDLFAKRVRHWDEDHSKDNPLARYLHDQLVEIQVRHGQAVSWDERESPRYMIGSDELVELLGANERAWKLIHEGKVALAEMPGDIRKADPEQRASWVIEQAALNDQELLDALNDLDIEKLGFKNLAGQMTKTIEQKKYDF